MAATVQLPFGLAVHGKTHKRGRSASSITTPTLPFHAGESDRPRKDSLRVTYADDGSDSTPTTGGHSLKIKPYLRKLSLKDSANGNNAIDLSRPTAENEKIASLGMHDYDYAAPSKSAADVSFNPIAASGRSRHTRTTSNNSQFSTASGHQRPTAPYAHPMRQTPRPYTPPITRSYTASSLLGSDISDEAMGILPDDDLHRGQHSFDPTRRSGSIGSLPTRPQAPYLPSSSSLTRLNASNPSQSSLPPAPTTRPRGDTLHSIDTATPSSRTSTDKAISFIRSGRDEPVDAASRAATIMAARIAYQEREVAKSRKVEKEVLKQQEKENRKRQQKEDRQRQKSEDKQRRLSEGDDRRSRTRTNSSNEKMEFVGKPYNDYTPANIRSLPAHVPTAKPNGYAKADKSRPSLGKSVKSTWLGFLAWFRTRLLRLQKKLGRHG
jgi:hypothetical protein